MTAREALDRTLLLIRQQRLPDVDDVTLVQALTETSVAIVADELNLADAAAQSAVTALTGLVLACGMKVRLVMPRVGVMGYQPPLVGQDLVEALTDLGSDSVPGAEAVRVHRTTGDDLVFVLGSTPWSGEGKQAWRLGADGWVAYLQPVGTAAGPIRGDFPIGALGAATVAAAEPFRAALRTAAELSGCEVEEPWQLKHADRISFALAPAGTPTTGFSFGAMDLVSGGALSTALLHALLRIDGLHARVRLFEPQALEPTNLNRYCLMRRSMIGQPKVQMLERWQIHDKVVIEGVPSNIVDSELQAVLPLAPWVFVGTDNVEARWLIQGAWPERLVVAGTAGFMAMSSEHDRGRPCAACRHAWTEDVPGEVPTVSFVSYFGGLLAASRLLRWAAAGRSESSEQATEAWVDRVDERFGYRHLTVQRRDDCPVGCSPS